MKQANLRLMVIVPVSITLILILLYTAFNSLKDALLVMANVVAATMGGVWALKLTGTAFSISAAVGFISIFGVAVQDGVLVDFLLQSDASRGLAGARITAARRRAARAAGRDDVAHRGAGLFPAAIATSIGSQAQKPLAIVVVGGMLVTLFLTRYLMPVLYSFFPAPAGHGECQSDLILGSHYTDRFLAAVDVWCRLSPTASMTTRIRGTLSRPSRAVSETTDVMKSNWKLSLAVILIAGGAIGRGAESLDPRPRRGGLEATVARGSLTMRCNFR